MRPLLPSPARLLLAAVLAAPVAWAQDDPGANEQAEAPTPGSDEQQAATEDLAEDSPQPAPEDEGEPGDEERALDGFEPLQDEPEPEGPYQQRLTPFGAVALGFSLPLDELDPGGQAQLSLGAQLPWLGGRLLPCAELGFSSATSSGRLEDERLPDGEAYSWDLAVRQLELGGGLRLRLLRGDAVLSPEFVVAAHAVRAHTVLEGRVGSTSAQPVHELSWQPGWRVTGGVTVAAGTSAVLIDLGYRSVPLDGVIAGETSLRGLVVGLGWRRTP
jgi:hypothetical protein